MLIVCLQVNLDIRDDDDNVALCEFCADVSKLKVIITITFVRVIFIYLFILHYFAYLLFCMFWDDRKLLISWFKSFKNGASIA